MGFYLGRRCVNKNFRNDGGKMHAGDQLVNNLFQKKEGRARVSLSSAAKWSILGIQPAGKIPDLATTTGVIYYHPNPTVNFKVAHRG
jgi:hypothetical protein